MSGDLALASVAKRQQMSANQDVRWRNVLNMTIGGIAQVATCTVSLPCD